jgi:hypothetical protein
MYLSNGLTENIGLYTLNFLPIRNYNNIQQKKKTLFH